VWNWHHGGGWNGPVVKQDYWNDANIYAAAHLAWDPDTDAETLAREWAALNFGAKSEDDIAELMLMSDDAVLKLVYFEKYAAAKGDPWMPNENWVRDDVIKGADRLSKIYELAGGDMEEMIAEKDEGVAIVEKMARIAAGLDLPDGRKRFFEDTIKYELYWARVLRDYAGAYFHWRRWQDKGDGGDLGRAAEYASSWRENWQAYRTEIPELEYAASLYNDDGMVAAMEKIEKDKAKAGK